jgi:hypothetical protein
MTRSPFARLRLVSSTKIRTTWIEEDLGDKAMNRVSLFASLIALSLGTVSVFHVQRQPNFLSTNENVSHITDGAFRDGLYLGRLAAENGVAPHVVSGRWATGADRASFTSGYQKGYEDFLADQAAH